MVNEGLGTWAEVEATMTIPRWQAMCAEWSAGRPSLRQMVAHFLQIKPDQDQRVGDPAELAAMFGFGNIGGV